MRSEVPLDEHMLKQAGVAKAGHRARILVRLEFEAGLFAENDALKIAILNIKRDSMKMSLRLSKQSFR